MPEKLPISSHQDWFDVLIKDDVELANIMLNAASNDERKILISCPFNYEELFGFGPKEHIVRRVTLPFHLAIAFCSKQVTDLLMKFGVDILSLNEEHADNALHSSIIIAYNKPEIEQEICATISWFLQQLNAVQIVKLLFHENKDGFRPIEFAAQQGCLHVMETLLETNGHKSKEVLVGLGVYKYYDVTEYEVGYRQSKSPINMLAYMDRSKLLHPTTAQIILSPLFSEWISAKIRSNMIPLTIWALLRMVFFVSFLVLDLDIGWLENIHGKNASQYLCDSLSHVNTGKNITLILAIFVIAYSTGTFITYAVEIIRIYKYKLIRNRYDLNGRKVQIANTWFYRSLHAILVLIVLLTSVQYIDIVVSNFEINYYTFLLADIARSIIPVLSLWSCCYFLQLVPVFGSSIISIQGMVVDMVKFMVLFMIIMLPFVHVFESFAMANSTDGCIAEFSSPYMTSYTLFRMMLNIYDVSGLPANNAGVLYALHIFYVFMVGVLLINFLIAMMTNSASKIAENQQVILKINQLAIVVSLEDRLYPICRWLYKRLRIFGFKCENDAVLIHSIGCRFSQLYNEKQLLNNSSKSVKSTKEIQK